VGEKASSYAILENILVLKKSSLFADVQTGELRAVAEIVDELSFKKGDYIVKERDLGDSLYMIKHGSVFITKEIGWGEFTYLAELSVGNCFGEMAIFDDEVRSASVRAKEDCVVLRIGRDDLLDAILEYPHIGIELLRIFVRRLRSANERMELLSQSGENRV